MTQKLVLILDIDNTILHSINKAHIDLLHVPKFEHVFEINDYDKKFQKITYLSFERPGLQPFLEFCFKHFTVGIWTAANKHYATQVLQECFLNKGFTPQFMLTYSHTEYSKFEHGGLKNIQYILDNVEIIGLPEGITGEDIIIIDDNLSVKHTNGDKCILLPSFYVYRDTHSKTNRLQFNDQSAEDTVLQEVQTQLSTKFNLG